MTDLYSTPEIVRLMCTRFKDYRMCYGLTQKDVSERSGIGLTTIHKFESGAADNLTLSTFILLMKAIGQINAMDNLLPELPECLLQNSGYSSYAYRQD